MAYQEGDPGHLSVHNALRAEIADAATEMGVEVVLPDEAVAGNTGHVDAHNLITDALAKIAAEGSAGASWAQVVSAPDAVTSSYYDDKGGQWQYYEWNAAGTFDVELSGGVLWVLAVGGGASERTNVKYEWSGQPGLVTEGLWEFGPGTHTVTVGAKGRGVDNETHLGLPSSIGDYGTQGQVTWGSEATGRGATGYDVQTGYSSFIAGDERTFATGYQGDDVPGRGSYRNGGHNDGCVIIATRIDVPTLPPAPPRLEVAPVVAAPVSISGPAVQEWLVRDKQGNRKVVYFLPGNTGAARSLGLTEEGAEALAARRDVLDAIATTDVPEDFEGDPVTLLPKKLRGELTGFVEVRATQQPLAVYSVTLGAGVLPGVMVAAGGTGGSFHSGTGGGGGAGGVIGQGAHVPVILPVQGTATYTVKVASTPAVTDVRRFTKAQHTTIEVQGQTPFASAVGGGFGFSSDPTNGVNRGVGAGGSGGGGYGPYDHDDPGAEVAATAAKGIPGQGSHGNGNYEQGGGGGGYSSGGGTTSDGGAGFDLGTALNLDPNDGLTGTFLDLVSVDGWIAGGGAGSTGTATAGGGAYKGNAKDYTGGGGGANSSGQPGLLGGAGAVYIITDPT